MVIWLNCILEASVSNLDYSDRNLSSFSLDVRLVIPEYFPSHPILQYSFITDT
jgi:hypothetical protein